MSSDRAKSGRPLQGAPKPPAHIPPTPPLFRRLDWLTFGVTTLLVFLGYWFTLAPDLTLEDSGELAVGSYYAGVPHPPGYPVWTIYTWLFTLIPFSNVAWRVALSSAVAGAFACGLLALMVSRGSSLLLEGIAEFKNIDRKWENGLCVVAGFVAGMVMGFNGFMWSQAVIVEVYTLSVLSFMGVLCSLLRWIYAPHQRRYLYWAFFWFGICFTNHQTLIVAAVGIEIAILAAHPRLGRDLFIANSAVYILGLLGKATGALTAFDQNLPLFMVYNVVGIGSIIVAGAMTARLGRPLSEWRPMLLCGLLWLAGSAFYFYMPIASMTNPPMNWGYPRTVEGFKHALTRGQYDKTNPTDSIFKFVDQTAMYVEGAVDEYGMVYLLLGLLPFVFYSRMQKRDRAWIIGLSAIYLFLAFLLMILLNPNVDRQSREQTRVFFTASHIVISIAIGYGIALVGGLVATHYLKFRRWLLIGGSVAVGMELFYVLRIFGETQFAILRFAALWALGLAIAFTAIILIFRQRIPLAALLVVFALIPARSILSNWSENEQRGHLFGYWFGHDMFTPPFDLYPEMTRDAILFGGTDPGRFNPTYMIFCESFTAPRNKRDPDFDRRDVYLITQNALADKTYLDYIRAHYNRSAQQDPYFFSELFRSEREREEHRTNLLARMLLPLDRAFTGLGERVEAGRRARGVYPPKEIHTPSTEDSQDAFQEYIMDAQRRLQHDLQFPNEPRQLRPGEDVRVVDNRVQVQGQVAVMAINGLLTRVIFDRNPDHEFFIEESFPLEWMFPYLTPFGVIMKINREPVPEITDEMVERDHAFWSRYSERLIGNWITYDTTFDEICDFGERTFLRRDFRGFPGDRKFVRNSVAQKAFSKLRSAIAGVYMWRLAQPKSVEEQERMFKEAEFSIKQSLAFCPYSPEAIDKAVRLLLSVNRVREATRVAETGLKFDPSNGALQYMVNQLRTFGPGVSETTQLPPPPAQLEESFQANPSNLQTGLQLAASYAQAQQNDRAVQVLDQIKSHPSADATTLLTVAQTFAQMGYRAKVDETLARMRTLLGRLQTEFAEETNDMAKAFQIVSLYLVMQETNTVIQILDGLISRPDADPSTFLSAAQAYAQLGEAAGLERSLQKLVTAMPDNPEAWYDLASVQAAQQKISQALDSLTRAVQLSQERREKNPEAKDLRATAIAERNFAGLRDLPEFQRLVRN